MSSPDRPKGEYRRAQPEGGPMGPPPAPAAVPVPSTPPTRPGPGLRQRWRSLPRDARDTLFLLGVIGWTVGPHLLHLPGWCSALTLLVLGWRALIALRGDALPGRWAVAVALASAVALTLLTERTLFGREAGVTLLVVLMALKTLELRARRDAVVVFFLGFFLVLTQCLYSQSLATALAMAVATWGLLTALVLANLPVGRPTLWRAGAVAARSALLGLPVMVLLFVLFPRFGPLWGLPDDSAGRTGLSGSLRLGGVAELANDDSIAMRVRFPGPVPEPHQLYFRGLTLSQFDGLDWEAPRQSLAARARAGALPAADLQVQGPPVAYELLLEPLRLPLLPLLEATPARAGDMPLLPDWALWQGPDLQWHTDRPVTDRLRVAARAYLDHRHGQSLATPTPPPTPTPAAAPTPTSGGTATAAAASLAGFTQLPPGFNPRSRAWAAQVMDRLGPVDAHTRAAAVLAHVRSQPYVYTLSPGVYGRDAVDEFWLDRREGFCEHYASAFVVLMRAMDVPARLVMGYQGAELPDADGWRIVRQSHAHAWAEYWTADRGWQRVDPTAAVAPERVRSSRPLPVRPGLMEGALRTVNPALAERLRRAWESLDTRWTQWVMGWSRSRQFDLLRALGIPSPDWTDLARVLVGVLAAGAAGAALWAWRDRHRQDPWQRLMQQVQQAVARTGVPTAAHHPPRTLAAAVRQAHGADGDALADALDMLDRRRHGPGAGPRLPERGAWQAVLREALRLRRLRGGRSEPPQAAQHSRR